ncbi:MAG TPA: hypothetical protein VM890_09875 [Longimicrobium sp.]|jgi:hypothetical protein|nr:hypothetical protein [Longimicrobium sp.]
MPRIGIQQFRAALAGRSSPDALVRAYRELTRRPELAARMVYGDWPIWNQGDSTAAA